MNSITYGTFIGGLAISKAVQHITERKIPGRRYRVVGVSGEEMDRKEIRSFESAAVSKQCALKLDRVQLVTHIEGNPDSIMEGFEVISDHYVSQQTTVKTYLRCRRLKNVESGAEAFWQYVRQHKFLAPSKVTLVGTDATGLTKSDFPCALANCAPTLAEFAFDFCPVLGIDSRYVKAHAIFGKSRPNPGRGGAQQLRYGSRWGDKLVRAYPKRTVGRFRVEIEMHSRLLRSLEAPRTMTRHTVRPRPLFSGYRPWTATAATQQ